MRLRKSPIGHASRHDRDFLSCFIHMECLYDHRCHINRLVGGEVTTDTFVVYSNSVYFDRKFMIFADTRKRRIYVPYMLRLY